MSRYQPPASSRGGPRGDPPLPKGVDHIIDILDDTLQHGTKVSVIGVVKDYMLPRATGGSDWKSKITLYDQSTEEWSHGINLNIFLPQNEMPQVKAGDIVIASMVKPQHWQGSPSLVNIKYATDIHVYDGQDIAKCKGSRSARDALKPALRKVLREPDQKEHEYVLWLYSQLEQTYVPDREEMTLRAEQTLNLTNKFSLLQDVKPSKFADIIAQVVKEPFDLGDKISLWVSDYTENSDFFNKTDSNSSWVDGEPIRDGDPYGYTSKWSKPTNSIPAEEKWLGPTGKLSIQLTCWEPHAAFIRSNVHTGDWVYLRNVQIGIGKNGMNIEGYLRTDRVYHDRVYVSVLDHTADGETMDPRLKDALRRKRDHGNDQKQALKGGTKRKAEAAGKSENAKRRRKGRREEKARAFKAQETKQRDEARSGLNGSVRCENADREPVTFSSILEPVRYDTTFDLPFTCAKYHTQARVVDFHPARLEDFAASKKINEFSALSDNSDVDSDSSASSGGDGRRGLQAKVQWEWRFALKLEEASTTSTTGKKAASAWVLVDNHEGQLLTSLDAADLRAKENDGVLDQLRQKLFILWGDLEERKSAIEAKKRKAGLEPPALDDDDDQDNGGDTRDGSGLGQTSNKPFACCIRQYGVKVKAEEDEEGIDGRTEKWQRVFGLFGTQIASA